MSTLENVTAQLQEMNGNQSSWSDKLEGIFNFTKGTEVEVNSLAYDGVTQRKNPEKLDAIREAVLNADADGEDAPVVGLAKGLEDVMAAIYSTSQMIVDTITKESERQQETAEKISNQEQKQDATDEKLKDREKSGEPKEKLSKKDQLVGSFKKGMQEGKEEDLFGGIFKALDDVVNTAGMWAGKTVKVLGLLKTGMLSLGSMLASAISAVAGFVMTTVVPAISAMFSGLMAMLAPIIAALTPILLPIAAIAAGITALVMGIQSFIDDFSSQEGTLVDKIIAGVTGFFKGIMKIFTIPLDWIKDAISGLLSFFGFDGAAKLLDSFSITEIFGNILDSVKDFVIGIKDKIVDAIVNFATSLVPDWIKNLVGADEGEPASSGSPDDLESNPDVPLGLDDAPTIGYLGGDRNRPAELTEEQRKMAAEDHAKLDAMMSGSDDDDDWFGESKKRGRVIGDAPAAPTKVNPATGKRGRVIGGPVTASSSGALEGDVPEVVGSLEGDTDAQLAELMSSPLDGIFDPLIDGIQSIKDWFAGLFDFSGLKETMTNMFAEIGIPRVEFDVPFIGSVGFGPFYPFRPGEGEYRDNTSKSLTTESSGSNYKSTATDNSSGITDDSIFSYATESVEEQSKNELGETENISTQTGVTASFDDMTGKGNVYFETSKTIDNLATDEFKELEDTVEKFEVGPIVMGQVRRMIEAGATPTQVKEFLKENEKTIADKITNFFAPATEELKEDATNMLGKVKGFFGFGGEEDITGANQAEARDNILSMEQARADNAKAEAAKPANNIVNAPSNSTTNVNNNSYQQGPMPSPMDKSDRTARGAYRGRRI